MKSAFAAALIVLALAAPAQAETAPGGEGVEAPVAGVEQSGGSETSAPAETPAESTAPAETPSPAEAVAPGEPAPPAEAVAPPEPPAESTPPVESTPPAETVPPAEAAPPAEPTPPTEAGSEPVPGPEAPEPPRGEAKTPTEPSPVRGGEGLPSGGTEREHATLTGTGAPGGGSPGAPATEPVSPNTPTGSEIVTLGTQPAAEGAPLAAGARQAERRAAQRSCELSMLGGPAASCSGGWATSTPATAAPGVLTGVAAAVLAPVAGADGGDSGDGGSGAAGGRPVGPEPGPAPGGAAGGVAAGGSGAGVGLSGFLTIAALLLLAAPRALRRLRLSCRPYRTAFFVLIPERPG